MKKVYFLALIMTLGLTSCNQKGKEDTTDSQMKHQDTTMQGNHAAATDEPTVLYACPMHPEVQGKKDDKCSKCGMKLTEPVTEKQEEKE